MNHSKMEEQLNLSFVDLKQLSNGINKPSRNLKRTRDEARLDICSHSENHSSSLNRHKTMSADQPTTSLTTFDPNCRNSSKAWLLGAVDYLKNSYVHKAKLLLRRGIRTINFREEEEKLNLWKALMNLEAYHDSREALLSTFEEALRCNNARKVYIHMLQLLMKTEKTEELEMFKDKIFKKFKTDKEVYLTLCEHYMKHGAKKEARSLFERSVQCVPPKEHPDILGKFASLEYKYGDIERSLNLYEEILVKYPKRKDFKSVYIQVLRSQGQEERANSLL